MVSEISIKKEGFLPCFDGDEYTVDLTRPFGGHEKGDIVLSGSPFDNTGHFPLTLEFAIRRDGSLVFRKWSFYSGSNPYFHISDGEKKNFLPEERGGYPFSEPPTEAQIDAVNGLFSGRIRFEGLEISIGATVQDICPINIEKEEKAIGKSIYLA